MIKMLKNVKRPNKDVFSATGGIVSASTMTDRTEKRSPAAPASLRVALTLHHASHLQLACEAAAAHHAILVPALYMRFTVSSFPRFLPAVRGRLNSLSPPPTPPPRHLALRTSSLCFEIHFLCSHYLTVGLKFDHKHTQNNVWNG